MYFCRWRLRRTLLSVCPMNADEIGRRIVSVKDQIVREVNSNLPRRIGNAAVNMTNRNFRDAGWRDGGLKPWKTTRRQQGKGKDSQYLPLHSRREHLSRSTQYKVTGPGEVTVSNPVPYAWVHNYGFDGTVRVGAHKRKILKKGRKRARRYAVRAYSRHMRIPRRQFMGRSRELNERITELVNETIERIRRKISYSEKL